jgi:hypothetical protein
MAWSVEFHDKFADEFRDWRHDVQKAAATSIATLELVGPMLVGPAARRHVEGIAAQEHEGVEIQHG